MTKIQYDSLTAKEKLIYDEWSGWTRDLNLRLDAITQVIQKLLDVATVDP